MGLVDIEDSLLPPILASASTSVSPMADNDHGSASSSAAASVADGSSSVAVASSSVANSTAPVPPATDKDSPLLPPSADTGSSIISAASIEPTTAVAPAHVAERVRAGSGVVGGDVRAQYVAASPSTFGDADRNHDGGGAPSSSTDVDPLGSARF